MINSILLYTLIIILYIYAFYKLITNIKSFTLENLKKAIFPEDYES